MSATISLTDTEVLTALRTFLIGILPAGTEVIRGQANRVPEPNSAAFVVMTPLMRERLETNVTTYQDGYPTTPGTRTDEAGYKQTVQLDIHGTAAADLAQIIGTLWRTEYATTAFAALNTAIAPLYCNEARQLQFITGEQQFENRWTLDVVMQVNPVITTGQDFAAALTVTPVSVDVAYPP